MAAARRIEALSRQLGSGSSASVSVGSTATAVKGGASAGAAAASTSVGAPGSGFRYTQNVEGPLSAAQRAFYEENGYILIKGLVDHAYIDELTQRFLSIATGETERGSMFMIRDVAIAKQKQLGESAITKLQVRRSLLGGAEAWELLVVTAPVIEMHRAPLSAVL